MKKLLFPLVLLSHLSFSIAQNASWKPVEGRIMTPWSDKVDPANPHPHYPRPQMERSAWINLNGIWNYSIRPASDNSLAAGDGQILVPFAVESALSGVGKTVGKDSVLVYEKTFSLPSSYRKGKVLLHFGAVDWRAEVFVNGQRAGIHEGGYDPFLFNITAFLIKGAAQKINVRVWDPSDAGPQPRGKQVREPNSIWYTPVTGIWQTVWVESVPSSYITVTKQTPDLSKSALRFTAQVEGVQAGDQLRLVALDGNSRVAETVSEAGKEITLPIPSPRRWSPDSPFLYKLQVSLLRKGRVVDQVRSYFAMRSISLKKDEQDFQRLALNGEALFQFGPLDQGWWPDGLYTSPTDEALRFDIEKTREMGFNMIRKHVKVEPARWYYYCDSIGMLVWQDMPSGDMGNRWDSRPGILGVATDKERTAESEAIFKKEWKAIVDAVYNFPSVVVWVPFNEGWGQFKTEAITRWTMEYDPSRLVNSASGGNYEETGHILDLHNYPQPAMPDPAYFGKGRAIVLGEYGGLGLPLEGHTWQQKNNWGYQSFKNKEELLDKYSEFVVRLDSLINKGLSAAVYTQTTDVEIEVNGLMTYDRRVIKFPTDALKKAHAVLYDEVKYSK